MSRQREKKRGKNNIIIETILWVTQVLDLADKVLKIAMINIFKEIECKSEATNIRMENFTTLLEFPRTERYII